MSEQKEFRAIIRIAGTDCNGNLKLQYGLSRIKGIGSSFANATILAAGLSPDVRLGFLTDEEVSRIETIFRDPIAHGIPTWMLNRRYDQISGKSMQVVGSDVDISTRSDVEVMKKIVSWKGVRHSLGLRVRGQRTKTTGRKGRAVGVVKTTLFAEKAAAAAEEEPKKPPVNPDGLAKKD